MAKNVNNHDWVNLFLSYFKGVTPSISLMFWYRYHFFCNKINDPVEGLKGNLNPAGLTYSIQLHGDLCVVKR